jgi:hypothetical protein
MASIHCYVAAQEAEATALRQAILTADQFAAAYPGSPAIMPPTTRAWILARIVYLQGLQGMIIGPNAIPPPIPVPTLASVFTNAPSPT